MDQEQLPLVHRDGGGPSNGNSANQSLQEQLQSYHKRQRARQRRHSTRRTIGRATVGFLAAALVTLLLVALSWPSHENARSVELHTLMDLYRDAKNFSGVVRLSHNGEKTFQEAMGRANVPFKDPMREHSIFPMGAHVQLFTSVALYQLQEKGRVQLSKPVNAYLDAQDLAAFGAVNQTQWCPTLAGESDADMPQCEQITFEQMMYMGSGLTDVPEHHGRSLATLGSLSQQINSFINTPLAFRPGTNYSYSDANYVLLAYMVEKLSGQSYEKYMDEHVFKPIRMKDTSYDAFAGVMGVQHGLVDQYVQYYAHRQPNASDSASASASDSGSESMESGGAVEKHMHHMATGSCQAYERLDSVGGGSLQSTARDMHRWYTDLFHDRGHKSKLLKPHSISQIVHVRNPAYPAFAQGIGVDFEGHDMTKEKEKLADWPSKIAFCGSTACTTTCMAMQMSSANLSIVASAFTNDMRLLFPSEEAFKAYRPRDFLDARSVDMATDGFEKNDGEVNTLAWNLLQVFLRYYTAPSN